MSVETLSPAHFAETYLEARDRFVTAARAAGARLTTFVNPCGAGPAGEDLLTHSAWLGDPAAETVVVLVSGTHGVEGFCGSACQTGLLATGLTAEAPDGTAFLLVHALNPHGFAYQRRVNEDNVDLNRNFVDHTRPPHNDAYDEVHNALVPADWDGPARAAADRFLGGVITERGLRHLQQAVTHGQYRHPDGLFYGGTAPVWSNRVLRRIAADELPGRRRIAYIDLHTGLGPWGHGEPIFRGGRDPGALDRARSWYGEELTTSEDGTSSSTPIIGNTATLIAAEIGPDPQLTAITLEFGTLTGSAVLTALRADNWLHLREDPPPALAAEIKAQIRAAFYPSDPEWRETVWRRAVQVFRQAFAGLRLP